LEVPNSEQSKQQKQSRRTFGEEKEKRKGETNEKKGGKPKPQQPPRTERNTGRNPTRS